MLDVWQAHVGPLQVEAGADVEDFLEQAARLDAAVSGFGLSNIWLTTDHEQARNLGSGDVAAHPRADPKSLLGWLPRYGSQPRRGAHDRSMDHALADDYWNLSTFSRYAGREIRVCDGDDLISTCADMVAAGRRRLFVKTTETKYGVYRLFFDGSRVVRDVVMEELGWDLIYMEGRRDAFIVQEHVDMNYEYRLFVVDGKLVTGAGNVERFTPIDNTALFDPKIEVIRNEGTIAPRPHMVDRYRLFGERVASLIATERPAMGWYVMDVASDGALNPLLVELNGLLNSGLYASDPRAVTSAMAVLADRSNAA